MIFFKFNVILGQTNFTNQQKFTKTTIDLKLKNVVLDEVPYLLVYKRSKMLIEKNDKGFPTIVRN